MIRSSIAKAAVTAALSFAAVTAVATTAEAQIGRINFVGSADVGNQPSNANFLLIDFLVGNPPTVAGTPTGTVTLVPTINGVFLPELQPGMTGTITDIVVGPTGTTGANTLTVGAYTFTFSGTGAGNTFGPISLFPVGSGTAAVLGVQGTVTGGDFGTQILGFNGVFSAQFADIAPGALAAQIAAGATLPVSISAEFNVVPEPSTYALLATGIGALGLVARRRRNQA